MKVNLLQFSANTLFLTPVQTGKRPQFGARYGFAFPEALKGAPLVDLPAFAQFVRASAGSVPGGAKKYIFSYENEDFITRQYQHLPAKEKRLPALARLEAETVLPDGSSAYMVENYEYGIIDEVTGKSTSVLFALRSETVLTLQKTFARFGVRIIKLIPPGAAIVEAARTVLDTSGKAVALVDVSAASTRLVLLKNGAPISQRNFEPIYDELIDLISAEQALSYADSAALIAREGFFPEGLGAPGAISSLVEASTGEVLRGLRMLLSKERLDLEKIVVSGSMTSLPGFSEYWQRLGLDIPVQLLEEAAARGALPIVNDNARRASVRPSSCLLASGIVALASSGRCDFLRMVHLRTANRKNNFAVMGAVTVLVLICMLLQPVLWYSDVLRQNADAAALLDTRFDEVKSLQAEQTSLSAALVNLEEDTALLPRDKSNLEQAVSELAKQVENKIAVAAYTVDGADGTIVLSFMDTALDDYISVKNAVIENGYFTVQVPFQIDIDPLTGLGSGSATLKITEFTPFLAQKSTAPSNETVDPDALLEEALAMGGNTK